MPFFFFIRFLVKIHQPLLCPQLCCWGGDIRKGLQNHHQLQSQNWERRGGGFLFEHILTVYLFIYLFMWMFVCGVQLWCSRVSSCLALQLCFDYQFDTVDGQHKIACHCGAPECRKWINRAKWKQQIQMHSLLLCVWKPWSLPRESRSTLKSFYEWAEGLNP